jgi:hypothetical protein
MIDFLFVDSQQNESLSGLFSIDSQGFIHTLISFDRELQSNYSLYISMYDRTLKSYASPTHIIIKILDENDNIPYEPFLSNSSILSIEQIDNKETIIYEFKPIDYDDGLNGFVSIECLNCTSIFYFYIRNSSILMTQSNIRVPDGIYTLAFILRDHGLKIFHRRFYTLTFNLTHRSIMTKQKEILSNNFLYEDFLSTFSWHYFLIIWLILFFIACWICYRYHRAAINRPIYRQEIISNLNESNDQIVSHENMFDSIFFLDNKQNTKGGDNYEIIRALIDCSLDSYEFMTKSRTLNERKFTTIMFSHLYMNIKKKREKEKKRREFHRHLAFFLRHKL